MIRFRLPATRWLALPLAALPLAAQAQTSAPADDPIARIKDEGMNRSQVMQTLSYLTDVIGPRLTGSPSLKRANEWTRERLTSFGLQNAHLEAWGPFGRGWELERFSAQVVAPQAIPLIAYPKAWSPGLKRPVTGEVVLMDAEDEAGLAQYKGRLRNAIVLTSPVRPVPAHFDALGVRYTDAQLQEMEAATMGAPRRPNGPRPGGPGGPGAAGEFQRRMAFASQRLKFLIDEGVAAVMEPSPRGDGGTIFVQSATVPQPAPPPGGIGGGAFGTPGTNAPVPPGQPPVVVPAPAGAPPPDTRPAPAAGSRRRGARQAAPAGRVSPWDKNAPKTVPQIVVAVEQYNRLVRMIQQGEKPQLALELSVKFFDNDLMAYNTVAEIPGTDKKDEIVMLGGHMDSWHSGTGATDNGAGCAVAMEAVRILKALNLQPRRTVRIALWSGEEEGLYGSRNYVAQHFASRETPAGGGGLGGGGFGAPPGPLTRKPEWDKLSGYFNLDNGTGKVRGVYLQGNAAVGPLFREWLAPFKDMGANTITIRNTGGTDHQSFDGVGLPGFQFIQDEIEYDTRTHHSNEDVYDRIQPEDMKQAAIIMAAFVYNTAMRDEMLPRKPLDDGAPRPTASAAPTTTPTAPTAAR